MKNNLRELRATRGWSQGALGEALGVSRQTINAIETEKYDPSLPLAFKIARLFDSTIENIFAEEGSRVPKVVKTAKAVAPVVFENDSGFSELPTHIL